MEKHVILNLTRANLGGDLHIFVKQLVVVLDYPSKIQYLKSAIDGKMHGQIRLKYVRL